MLITPENIRTLQRKLYRKAKQDPVFRFYALYDKVCRADILSHAYRLVRANGGSAGVDGVTFRDIRVKEGEAAFLAELEEALKTKTYKASPVKRVMIPKGDGSMRPLGIPTISMGSTKCRQQQAGRMCMPSGEEHRKAVCGKTARTV